MYMGVCGDMGSVWGAWQCVMCDDICRECEGVCAQVWSGV